MSDPITNLPQRIQALDTQSPLKEILMDLALAVIHTRATVQDRD
jgi:hypothetical protein